LTFEPKKLNNFPLPLLKDLLSNSLQVDSTDLHEREYNLMKMSVYTIVFLSVGFLFLIWKASDLNMTNHLDQLMGVYVMPSGHIFKNFLVCVIRKKKNDTKEVIYKTKWTYRHRKQTYSYKGKGGGIN